MTTLLACIKIRYSSKVALLSVQRDPHMLLSTQMHPLYYARINITVRFSHFKVVKVHLFLVGSSNLTPVESAGFSAANHIRGTVTQRRVCIILLFFGMNVEHCVNFKQPTGCWLDLYLMVSSFY